jgi:formamidopyrimidine-DNA glycosylase
MPELPEVTTTVNGINAECTNWTIQDVWTDLAVIKPSRIDFYNTIKYLPYFKNFTKVVKGKKIINATRRGKNILIKLDGGQTILIHMKMTGHMMTGIYEFKSQKLKVKNEIKKIESWEPSKNEKNLALLDPYNRFIHFVFTIQKGKQVKHLVLCDSRKFAKVALLECEDHHKIHLHGHGPEPINPDISYTDFKKSLDTAPQTTDQLKYY